MRPLSWLVSSALVPGLASLLAQPPLTPAAIVRKSLEKDSFNFDRAKDYTYVQRIENRQLTASGTVAKVESSTYDVLIIGGRPYRKLIASNDRPLPERKARDVQSNFDKELRKRSQESDRERRNRAAEEERQRRESRIFVQEIPEAFIFTLDGQDSIDGAPVWVISAQPRPGWRGKVRNWQMLTKFKGRLWISTHDYQWVKVEAETVAPVSFGWVLARLQPGARLTFQQQRVNSEVWMPVRASTKIDARLALFKKVRAEVDVVWRDYRKFQADSRVVSAEEIPPPNPLP